MDPSYEPEPRYQHCSALVQDKWYNYGGMTSDGKRCSPDVIEEFDPAHQVWKQHPTHGDTPPGYIGSAATSIGSKFYHFGGSFHNTISELDVSTFKWKKLEPTNEDGICPIPIMDAEMIAFDNRLLVIYGGKGITPDGETTWTNQLLCFDIETRKWYIPTMSGESNLTPCEGCTFTKVDYYRAVLFGGHKSENCLRILDMKNWIWNVEKSSSDRLWPDLRGYHLAMSLRKIGSKEESPEDPQLMILFGMDQNSENIMDSWVYNFRKKRWTLGAFPEKLVQRSVACVKNSTCLLYHNPKSPSTDRKTLFQFGGVKCTPSSPTRSVNNECKADLFLYSTNVLEMDTVNDSLVVTSAKRLKIDWLSVNPDYPELIHFEEERKQTFHLSPGKEQHMDLSDIGISLRIYDSESEGDSEFSVLPAVGGPFAMPPGYEPKSPIYMMNESNKKIKKNITVTMGHCANLESEKDCKKMIFLKGCADPVKEGSRLIYKFEVVAGANGKFAKGDRQGEITLQEAVPLCIANKQSKSRKKSLTTAYFLKLYSTPSPCDNYCAILAVSIYQDLYVKLLSSFMRKKYPALTESAFKPLIHFDEDQIKIKWNTGKAWTVISDIDPPMIRQEEVDLPNSIEGHGITFEDGEIYPPRIKLIFTPEEPHVQSNCKITVLGLTEDISLNLSMTPETPRSSLYEKKVEPGHREAYLRELSSLLDPAAFKWESIGIALDFSTGDLHNIKHNYTLAPEGPRAFLRVLIQQWLGWTPPDHNFPTLESLYNALKTPNVDEQVLAEKLLQKIMTEKLMQRNPDIKTRVNDSIGKLVTTTLQWKGNEMITKTGEVVSWMNEIMKNLKEPSDLFSKAGMIKSHCEAISQLSQDVLQEAEAQSVNGAKDLKKYKECVITASQLLHKQAHLQLTYSQGERMEEKWVPAMESVINQIINLADALKKLLEQTDLVVRETPKSTKSNQWTIVRPLTRHGGYVETMRRKIPITGVFGAIAHPRGYSVSTKKNRLELPGVVFYQEPSIKGNITFNKEVNLKGTGIWLSIPKNSSSEEPLTIYIRTCFSGPFELPEDYEPASSAYLIKCSRKVVFQKSITVKIHHYVCLESEEDCDDMVFLSASSIPKYGKSGPRYSFREIEDARVSFRPGHQVGDIMLKHFCVIRAGKRKRKKSDSSRSKKHKGNTLYSARLYRNRSQKSVTFCICLYNKVYIEHCDSVIMKEDARRWELSAVPAQLTSDEITLSVIDGTGWIFDREPPEILKRSIHLPEEFEGISECSDYPPRLSLQYSPTELEPTDEHPNLTKLRVFGLDRELNFIIKVPHHESPAPTPVNIPSSPMVIPHRLSMDDLPRVVPFLEHMDNDQLIALGCQLGLSYCGLKRMETGDLLREMVAAWLRREDNVILLSGTPSWNSLVAALEKIHQNGIAFEIKAAHSFEQWQPTQMYSSTPP